MAKLPVLNVPIRSQVYANIHATAICLYDFILITVHATDPSLSAQKSICYITSTYKFLWLKDLITS